MKRLNRAASLGWAVLLAGALMGCEAPVEAVEPEVEAEAEEEEATMGMPDVEDAEALEAWLRGEGNGQVARVPLWVEVSPLGVSGARVGGASGVEVRVDDSRLGVGLADRVRSICAGDEAAAREDACVLWVRARVGAEGPGLGMPTADRERVTLVLIEIEGL